MSEEELKPKEQLKSIAKSFRNEINTISSVIDEIYLTLGEKNTNEIIKMGIVYLMTYLEGFNREFFINFLSNSPHVMSEDLKNKKDQKKLKLSYSEIKWWDMAQTLDLMAKKMHDEVFDYHKLSIERFISKFLDGFLELDFQNECKRRNIDILILQKYRDLRNAIVHYKELNINEKDTLSFTNCRDLILDYIILVEELIFNKYFVRQDNILSFDDDPEEL